MTITRKQKWEEKQLYGRFKQQINNISHDKTRAWLRKGNFKRQTESLLIATQSDAIRTNHIKTANVGYVVTNRNDQSHNKRMQQISTEGV